MIDEYLECYVINNFIWSINKNVPWPLVKLIPRSSKKLIRNKHEKRPWNELFVDDIFARDIFVKPTLYITVGEVFLFSTIPYLMKKRRNLHIHCFNLMGWSISDDDDNGQRPGSGRGGIVQS